MKRAPIPENEAARLAALRALDILDTPREERFDRLVRLACAMLDVPMAAVSLVDESRQWFKAEEGLGVCQTDRDISFCGHAIMQPDIFVVGDALQDPRFADNPLVEDGPRVRAYAGQPLRAPDGHRIGTLCVIDQRPRDFSTAEIEALEQIAAIVEREIQVEELVSLQRRMQVAESSAARLSRQIGEFFELSVDMLCIADTNGFFRRLNPAWTKNLGWSPDELMARPYLDFVHPEDHEKTLAEVEVLSASGRTVSFENRYRRSDGSWRTLLWNAAKSDDENLIYAIARDVTEQRRVETMKNEFVSTVSHELRTPLTSIRGALDLVAGGVAGSIPDEASEMLAVARSNCDRLALLINDILDMEKIESGRMDFRLEVHEITTLVKTAARETERFAEQHGVSLRVEAAGDRAHAMVDASRLHQVLGNLLSNAAKFGPEGSEITARVEPGSGEVRVSIEDRGVGIPDAQKSRIFEKFVQVDSSSTREKGGTGLGLSISRAIVERLGGRIGVEDRAGGGSCFWFSLPTVATAASLNGMPGSRRILVCDDDSGVASALGSLIESAGFSCDTVGSAAEARARLAMGGYAAMTLDLVLPDATGFDLLRELRSNAATIDLPVIVVSASVRDDRPHLEGSAIGVVDWIAKPLDESRLIDAIRRVGASSGPPRVLHVEDDLDVQLIVGRLLADVADVRTAETLGDARRMLATAEFDLVLLDLRLPDGNGRELLQQISGQENPVPVVVFSAHDVGEEFARDVAAVLLKSRTSNQALRDTILAHAARPACAEA